LVNSNLRHCGGGGVDRSTLEILMGCRRGRKTWVRVPPWSHEILIGWILAQGTNTRFGRI